jgi:hypothetical protein
MLSELNFKISEHKYLFPAAKHQGKRFIILFLTCKIKKFMETNMIVSSIEWKYILAHRCPLPPIGNRDQTSCANNIFNI